LRQGRQLPQRRRRVAPHGREPGEPGGVVVEVGVPRVEVGGGAAELDAEERLVGGGAPLGGVRRPRPEHGRREPLRVVPRGGVGGGLSLLPAALLRRHHRLHRRRPRRAGLEVEELVVVRRRGGRVAGPEVGGVVVERLDVEEALVGRRGGERRELAEVVGPGPGVGDALARQLVGRRQVGGRRRRVRDRR